MPWLSCPGWSLRVTPPVHLLPDNKCIQSSWLSDLNLRAGRGKGQIQAQCGQTEQKRCTNKFLILLWASTTFAWGSSLDHHEKPIVWLLEGPFTDSPSQVWVCVAELPAARAEQKSLVWDSQYFPWFERFSFWFTPLSGRGGQLAPPYHSWVSAISASGGDFSLPIWSHFVCEETMNHKEKPTAIRNSFPLTFAKARLFP